MQQEVESVYYVVGVGRETRKAKVKHVPKDSGRTVGTHSVFEPVVDENHCAGGAVHRGGVAEFFARSNRLLNLSY